MPKQENRGKSRLADSQAGSNELKIRPFAWDGVSFQVPENWNLAIYNYPKRVTRLEFEDDFTIRLEAEWTRPTRPLDIQKIQKRYDLAARKFTEQADQSWPVKDLPSGWVATLFRLPEGQRLLTAIFMAPESSFFAFFLFHFEREDPEDPKAVVKAVAGSFELQAGPTRRWVLYDIAVEVPVEFNLVNTRFETGLKLLVFRWKMRKLHIWFANLAAFILSKYPQGEWAARLLNSSRLFRSLVFSPDGTDPTRTAYRRRRRHRWGHIDEIIRRCFQYRVECLHDTDTNMLIPWVFNHRKEEDLTQLEQVLVNGKPLLKPGQGGSSR